MDKNLLHEEHQKNIEVMRENYYKRHKNRPPLEMLEDGSMVSLDDPQAIALRIKEGRATRFDVQSIQQQTVQDTAQKTMMGMQGLQQEKNRQQEILKFFPEMGELK